MLLPRPQAIAPLVTAALLGCSSPSAAPATQPSAPAATTPSALERVAAHPLARQEHLDGATHVVTCTIERRFATRILDGVHEQLRLPEAVIVDQLRGSIARASFPLSVTGDPSLDYPLELTQDRLYAVLLKPRASTLSTLAAPKAPMSWQQSLGRSEVLAVYDLDVDSGELRAHREAVARFAKRMSRRCDAACFANLRGQRQLNAEAMMSALMQLRRVVLPQLKTRSQVEAFFGQADAVGGSTLRYDLNHAARLKPSAGLIVAQFSFTFDARGRLSSYGETFLRYEAGTFVPMSPDAARAANLTWYTIEALERR